MKKNLLSTVLFLSLIFISVTAQAQPKSESGELIEQVQNQRVLSGRKTSIPLKLGQDLSKVELAYAPPYIKLIKEESKYYLLIEPNISLNESASSNVVVRATNKQEIATDINFRVDVIQGISIEKASYKDGWLSISGIGFDTSDVQVFINNKDVTEYLVSKTETNLILKADRRVLGIGAEHNRLEVRSRQVEAIHFAKFVEKGKISPANDVQNIQVEVGRKITIDLKINDNTDNPLTIDFKCDRGDFVSLSGSLLTIDPMNKDLGITTCTLKVTDSVGLSTSTVLFITVVPCSIPLNFIDLADQDLKVGEVRFVNVRVNNPCGLPPIALSLPIAPNYVTLTDAGNGTGTVRISPQRGDIGGRIIIEARDSVGLFTQSSFNISLKIGGTVSSVNFSKPNLTISGNGFGNGGARISINNMDVTSRINTQNDTLITLRGNKKRLNLKTGPNLIRITPASNNGTDILEFVFDF